jgi:hypothetical protein
MKRFTTQFFVALLTFIIGISVFVGWFAFRRATSHVSVNPATSETQPQIQRPELTPLLQKHNLIASPPGNNRGVLEIEEADARLYAPIASETIFLKAPSPTEDSKDVKPRYWLRVEDYPSSELAQKRAKEYINDESYERMAQAYGHNVDRHVISKLSLRIWAIARGKRVYALTTDVYLLELIKLPKQLKESVSALPEI